MPFHKILSVFTVTEVRPSAVLYPFLGISFGWPSALGIMTANFISDAVNGYSTAILLEGLVPQLLYAIVPYYLWKRLMRGEDHKHRLDCVGRVLKYVLVCFTFSVLSLTRNECIILITAIVQVVLMTVVGVSVYAGGKTLGTYDIWNTIYMIGLVVIHASMLLSVGCMALFGKKE